MALRKEQALALIERHWKLIVLLIWAIFCSLYVLSRYVDIVLFNLPDSDDNMRLMQVRALLHGQGWYDLRQYRLNPPFGANIHWSRMVDLPIAGLILGFRTFLDTSHAERFAVAMAPLLPLLVAMVGIALTARRLIDPKSYPVALVALFFCGTTAGMFIPERIDHHGWQLALLALGVAGLADPKGIRGGITVGVASALSLAIGLEMIVYIALAGAAIVLFWVANAGEKERVRSYAASLSAAVAASFLLFASYDNRLPVCDALSPPWLADALLAGALLYGAAWLSPVGWHKRLGVAAAAAAVLATFHALSWPQCVGRFDAIPPEAELVWRRYVMEAQPFYRQNWRLAVLMIGVPAIGLIGWAMLAWSRRHDPDLVRRIVAGAVPTLAATLLLFWQSRTSPAAQMMATVGCAAFVWLAVPTIWRLKPRIVGFAGAAAVTLVGIGAVTPVIISLLPTPEPEESEIEIVRANAACTSRWAMQGLDAQPRGVVFTFLDLGPWLITATHHDAVAGPYHRNSSQIVDAMQAFLGTPEQAHSIVAKYHSNYLLTCPNSWTAQHFLDESPRGFYAQLDEGRVPKWLAPVEIPEGSPFKMWKVVG